MRIGKVWLGVAAAAVLWAQKVDVQWDKVERVSKTTATLQVVVNPPLRRGSAIHDRVFSELQALGADYVRYVPWMPYPRLGVAELQPPTKTETFWDFSLLDPLTEDFLKATKGHPVVINFSTIPQWMYQTPQPVKLPDDPNEVIWNYSQGTDLRDPSMKELSDYYARLVSWYTQGGFNDELGRRHESGHHFKIDYWEVLNEPDFEHNHGAEQYTARYDAIVAGIRKVAPGMKFVGLSLAMPSFHPKMFEYFLDPAHHQPGTPLDMISYHFYASPSMEESPDVQQYTYFDQADGFLTGVRFIEAIRQRLAPSTQTTVNEIGSILGGEPDRKAPIPNSYWNLSGATYAYVFGNLAVLGIDVAGESQLVGYPTQFPSVSMVDWTTGAPNARFRVLQLLKNNFQPGDQIVQTTSNNGNVYALAMVKPSGEHKILLVNKRDREITVTLPQPMQKLEYVDQSSQGDPPVAQALKAAQVTLRGLAVAVVSSR